MTEVTEEYKKNGARSPGLQKEGTTVEDAAISNTFGLPDETIAKVYHEANKAYCESLGDMSQKSWAEADEWQRTSAIKGVAFHRANRFASPADSHNSWMKEKEAEGWKYGPVKDVEKKEHPCYVPYNELPFAQRVKDYIFKAVVNSMVLAEHQELLAKGAQVLTAGEYRVGIGFNPGNHTSVGTIKQAAADLIDMSDRLAMSTKPEPEVMRCFAEAKTCIETGAMYAVKGATKPPRPHTLVVGQ